MRRLALLLLMAGCAHEATGNEATPTPKAQPGVALVTAPPATKAATRIELTAVTLADDCGGTPPWSAPVKIAKAEQSDANSEPKKAKAKNDAAGPMAGARAKRRCEQTSMQLAILAGDASNIHVKSVELFDDAGKSLGTLSASKPTRWSDANGSYEPWDETVTAGSTSSVSYVLTQPKWDQIGNRWNRTYTLKTVLSVGGVDQPAQKDVMLTDSNHARVRPPRELAWALAMFVYSLSPPPSDAPPSPRGAALFTRHCTRCHANAAYGGNPIAATTIGTDPALATGRGRGTGKYRVPTLLGVRDGAPYLHHGTIRSLAELLSPNRREPGHPAGTGLAQADRDALIAFLQTL